ncbi:hypothetical protein [Micromonospora sp. NPDC005299]|uniref:hypothetical protein n=1 Tax=Micromonospora sp. NPDC005299 TaxID=3364231 RepID=UPI00368B6B7F
MRRRSMRSAGRRAKGRPCRPGRTLLVEPDLDPGLVAGLRSRGHEITVAAEPSVFGYGQAIWQAPGGGYVAGSESRVDGAMLGW